MKDFIYDSDNHIGYYKGNIIPSVTQLVDIVYPMGDVPQDRLDKACEYGSNVHNDIEMFNKGIIASCETQEGCNYTLLLEKFGLECIGSELMVFITDENGDIICYGTLDLVLRAKNESILAKQDELVLGDIKTVSQFDNKKVKLQTNIYNLGLKQANRYDIDKLCGIWLRETTMQIRPLEFMENIYQLVKDLVKEWHNRYDTRVD